MTDTHSQLQLLSLLLDRTRSGAIKWSTVEPDLYEATGQERQVASIQFRYPLMGDEVVSGADLIQVTIGRLSLTFCSGTEGADRVLDILAAGMPSWSDHAEGIRRIEEEARTMLESLTGQE
jgi:hypothetical protein